MEKYKQKLVKLIKEEINVEEVTISIPPNSELGDLSIPCFSFSKALKKSPVEIANNLKEKINEDFIEKIDVVGGYLNFFLKKSIVIKDVIEEVRLKKDKFGSSRGGKGRRALIEHTSINPNASPHIGRARNAMIGDVIVRLLKFEEYDVNVNYFVNDVGKQIAMLVLGAKDKENITFNSLLDIYIDINKKVEENTELEKEVFELLYKFENGDEEVREHFRKVVDICINGQTGILEKMGIKFDEFKFESDYIFTNTTDKILDELKNTGKLFEDEDGRYVLNQEGYDLPMKAPYLVLTRKDKTSLYPLRDIAYTIDKINENSEYNIIVLGEDQKLYFKQISAVMDLLGYKSPECIHYSFVLLTEGKMSTRKGTLVLLEDLMTEAKAKVISHMEDNNRKIDDNIVSSVAFGAIKYAILKVNNEKNVTFDWESALSFEGDSGPYLQYSLARINSIFNKFDDKLPESIDYNLLKETIEYEIIKDISQFPIIVNKALNDYSPNIIANYVYSLTKKFSNFYHKCPVLNADDKEITEARLLLLDCIKQVINNSLNLLGIDTVDYM